MMWATILLMAVGGCKKHSVATSQAAAQTVVLYTSVDEPYVRPLVERFKRETGIAVTLITDAEASKTVGLAERLRAERDHPNADVWWDNECFLTLRLADENVLAPYESPAAADIPAKFKDAEGHLWAGSVLRARVIVSSQKLPSPPKRLKDLLRPELRDKIALARPTAGTTGGQVAALYTLWGDERADAFFHALHDNGAHMLGGNGPSAESVARGDMLAGLCDNDDAASSSAEIGPMHTELPDQGEGEDGTLIMPCAVALITHAPHPEAGQKLIDFLLSADVDRAMLESKFAWASARDGSKLKQFKLMNVDYRTVARGMSAAIRRATAILDGR